MEIWIDREVLDARAEMGNSSFKVKAELADDIHVTIRPQGALATVRFMLQAKSIMSLTFEGDDILAFARQLERAGRVFRDDQ